MAIRDLDHPRDRRVVPNDLPDDTEESIVGTEWHQEANSALAAALASIAARRGASWAVCEEVGLSGLFHVDGRPYTPRPDVFVLAAPIDNSLAEVALTAVGPPLLVVEVGSGSTLTNDLGDKRTAYEGAGVREYLVFDPTGETVTGGLRGWRRGAGGRFEEQPLVGGVWRSRELEVSFAVDGPFVRVRDRDGLLLPLAREAPLRALQAEEKARQEASAQQREAAARQREAAARLQAEERARQWETQVQREAAARRQAEEDVRRMAVRLQALEDLLRQQNDAPSEGGDVR